MYRRALTLLMLAAFVLAQGCVFHSKAVDAYNGLNGPDGKQKMHINTSTLALHLLMAEDKPLWGDASLNNTVSQMTAELAASASDVQIVQSSTYSYWWAFFPFTVVLTPMTSNVAANGTIK